MCSFIFFISTVGLHPGRFHSHDPSASQQSYLIRNNKSAQFVNIYFNVFVAFTFGHTLEPNQHFTVTWCTFLQIRCASSLSACISNKKNLHNVYIALQKQNNKKKTTEKRHAKLIKLVWTHSSLYRADMFDINSMFTTPWTAMKWYLKIKSRYFF